jgi:hypothetical protein
MVAQYGPMNYPKNVFILPLLNCRFTGLKVLPRGRDQTPYVSFYIKGEEWGIIVTVFYSAILTDLNIWENFNYKSQNLFESHWAVSNTW